MRKLKKIALILISIIILIFISFRIYSVIAARSIDKIVLIVDSFNSAGMKTDSLIINKTDYSSFVRDYTIKYPVLLFLKFRSCYTIKIYYKNGQIDLFATNGQAIHMINSSSKQFKYYEFLNARNIITKYWDIPEDKQCKQDLILK